MNHPVIAAEKKLPTADGFVLGARIYEPVVPPRAVAVIHGGTAIPQAFYRRLAAYLARAGIRVITYDYRGVGESRPRSLRGFSARMRDWATDADAAMALAKEGGLPILWIGHSFGGQLLGLAEQAHHAAAAVLIGAQLGYAGHWPARLQPRIRLFWHLLVPTLTAALGYYPGRAGLGEDLPAGVAQQWRRWALHPAYYLSEYPQARERLARFRQPTLFYSFTDDDFAPEPAVQKLLSLLSAGSGAGIIHRRLTPRELGEREVGHFGAFRARFEASLWGEILAFIDHVLEGKRLPGSLSAPPAVARQGFLGPIDAAEGEDIERFLYLREAR